MRLLASLLLALAVPALAGCGSDDQAAASEQIAPGLQLTGRVVDAADILDAATEARITHQLEAIEAEIGPQVVVVSTADLGGHDIADYAMALGNRWGVGDRERKDGLLLVIAPNERKVRIDLGTGLQGTLSDALCADIIENDIIPSFAQRNFAEGALNGVARLDYELRSRLQKQAA